MDALTTELYFSLGVIAVSLGVIVVLFTAFVIKSGKPPKD
jgi:hypothetical protein